MGITTPVFDTSRQAEPSYTDLPAAHRYINGNTSYLTSDTTATVTNLTVTSFAAP